MLKDVKNWVTKSKGFLSGISSKIRYAADIVDWFVGALDSLPLPDEGSDKQQNESGKS